MKARSRPSTAGASHRAASSPSSFRSVPPMRWLERSARTRPPPSTEPCPSSTPDLSPSPTPAPSPSPSSDPSPSIDAGRESLAHAGTESILGTGAESLTRCRSMPVGAAVAGPTSEPLADPISGSVARPGHEPGAAHRNRGCRRSLPRHLFDGAARGGGGGAPSARVGRRRTSGDRSSLRSSWSDPRAGRTHGVRHGSDPVRSCAGTRARTCCVRTAPTCSPPRTAPSSSAPASWAGRVPGSTGPAEGSGTYAHLSDWNLDMFSTGDPVHTGDVIGYCG